MRQTIDDPKPESIPDFTVFGGCILCDGDLVVRVTPSGARGYCPRCVWLPKASIDVSPDGVRVGTIVAERS